MFCYSVSSALYISKMKISTKTGDKGDSGLFDGKRLRKSAPIFAALGDLDELNSFLGWARNGENPLIEKIQRDIYRIMSIVGFEMKVPKNIDALSEKDVQFLEEEIEKIEGDLREFVLPGSKFDIARCVCRRAERSFVGAGLEGDCLKYLNRLSDLLFLLARKSE